MHVQLVAERYVRMFRCTAERNVHAIAHHGIEDAYDVPVLDAILTAPAVVSADDIIIFSHPEDTVQDVLTIVALIERHIEPMKASFWFLGNNQYITVFTKERHHAVARIGIDQHAMFLQYFFEGGRHGGQKLKMPS